jgi:hypothetical protein
MGSAVVTQIHVVQAAVGWSLTWCAGMLHLLLTGGSYATVLEILAPVALCSDDFRTLFCSSCTRWSSFV